MESTTQTFRFRTRLEQIVKTEGRNMAWLAREVGVTRQQISLWAGGLHIPEDRKQAIADALGRTVEDISGGPR